MIADKKLRIYLAGPINNCTDEECNNWRNQIINLLTSKHVLRNPMDRDYRSQYTQTHMSSEIVELDKRDIDLSDIIIANITKHSAGTAMEMLYAWERQKVVVAIANSSVQLSPWHIYHATKIVYTLQEAVDWIEKFVK